MPALSEKDQAELLMRVLECTSQAEGWSQVLEFIDHALECKSFLAEFDEDGAPYPHFGGHHPAHDLGLMLEQIETQEGQNALQFLLSDASLLYPYCKTSLDRNRISPGNFTQSATQPPEQIEDKRSNEPADDAADQIGSLRVAPGLVSPIWRTDRSTILFSCVFLSQDPNDIDVALARETFRTIVKALAPALNLHFQMEKQRQSNQFFRMLLATTDAPAVLINADRDILAHSPSGLEALARSDAATQRRQKLLVKNKQMDAALLELAVATRHMSDRPMPGVEKHPHRAVSISGPDGLFSRVLIKTVYPVPLTGPHSPPLFIIKLSEAREVPQDIERCLQDHFDLSQSEAHLARRLTMTGSMNATVDDLGITRNTAKTHLRRIYEKTGVNTQLQLAKLVHRLAQLF